MFLNGQIRVTGKAGALLYGWHEAAVMGGWTIARNPDTRRWILRATIVRTDAFAVRQRPLLFTAPRPQGFWAWPIVDVQYLGPTSLVATLGPPEQ